VLDDPAVLDQKDAVGVAHGSRTGWEDEDQGLSRYLGLEVC